MKKKVIITFCAAVPIMALAVFLCNHRRRYAVR